VATSLQTTTLVLSLVAILGPLSAGAAAAPQSPENVPPVSLERVQDALNNTPAQSLKFDAKMPVPAATFRVTVNQRVFVLPILETLRKNFELTPLQRQSADWSSRCCGVNLLALSKSLSSALQAMEERRIHDRVSRELAEVQAAARRE
jgi:hypothetical protein